LRQKGIFDFIGTDKEDIPSFSYSRKVCSQEDLSEKERAFSEWANGGELSPTAEEMLLSGSAVHEFFSGPKCAILREKVAKELMKPEQAAVCEKLTEIIQDENRKNIPPDAMTRHGMW
jgi:hypothetical protein